MSRRGVKGLGADVKEEHITFEGNCFFFCSPAKIEKINDNHHQRARGLKR